MRQVPSIGPAERQMIDGLACRYICDFFISRGFNDDNQLVPCQPTGARPGSENVAPLSGRIEEFQAGTQIDRL